MAEYTIDDLAKCIALRCFRNSELENIHAGITPHTEAGDFSDVYVVTPAGKIPWHEVSKISDEEMKVLMIDVVDRVFTFLSLMEDETFISRSVQLSKLFTHNWSNPKLLKKF